MRYIDLSDQEVNELTRIYENSDNKVERKRSHCLLLSNNGIKIPELIKIFNLSRRTIERLFNAWEQDKYTSLRIKNGRGAKCILEPYEEFIRDQVKVHNRKLTPILTSLEDKFSITTTCDTLRRFLKT